MILLILLAAGSLLWIVQKGKYNKNNASDAVSNKITAEIYQDGALLYQIDLTAVDEPYTITVTATDGGENRIAVEKNRIGMIAADCPDKLCVKQGFIHSSLLPITCLPHHLVIQIVEDTSDARLDAIAY